MLTSASSVNPLLLPPHRTSLPVSYSIPSKLCPDAWAVLEHDMLGHLSVVAVADVRLHLRPECLLIPGLLGFESFFPVIYHSNAQGTLLQSSALSARPVTWPWYRSAWNLVNVEPGKGFCFSYSHMILQSPVELHFCHMSTEFRFTPFTVCGAEVCSLVHHLVEGFPHYRRRMCQSHSGFRLTSPGSVSM